MFKLKKNNIHYSVAVVGGAASCQPVSRLNLATIVPLELTFTCFLNKEKCILEKFTPKSGHGPNKPDAQLLK